MGSPHQAGEDRPMPPVNSRRRVLAVDTNWFSTGGGINTFNRLMCKALADAGCDVCCLIPGASKAEEEDASNARVTLVGPKDIPGATEENALFLRPDLPDGFTPDIIIGHGRVSGPAAEAQKQYFPNAVHLYVMHTAPDQIEWHKSGTVSPAVKAETKTRIETELARRADHSLAVGPLLAAELENLLNRPNVLSGLSIYPGFDGISRLEPRQPKRQREILIMGRMEDHRLKGLALAARALGHVRSQLGVDDASTIKLVVRGVPPDEADKLRTKIQKWAGWPGLLVVPRTFAVNEAWLEEDLRRATLVLMPSRAEGYGLVGVEAISLGTPVLISEASGLAQHLRDAAPEYYDRIVVPVEGGADDVRRWGDAIAAVLKNSQVAFDRAAALARHMRTTVTWKMAAQTIIDLVPQGLKHTDLVAEAEPSALPIRRDTLSVLMFGSPENERLLRELRVQVAAVAPHVHLWTVTEDDEQALRRANAVIVVLGRRRSESVTEDAARRLIRAAQDRRRPVVVIRTDPAMAVPDEAAELSVVDIAEGSASEWRRLHRLLDELGSAEDKAFPVTLEATAEPRTIPRPSGTRRVNEMPRGSSVAFVDREDYLPPLCDLIRNPEVPVVLLHGRDGIGKTAMLRHLYDDPAQACPGSPFDGIVYLSYRSHRWITPESLLADIARIAQSGADDQPHARRPWRTMLGEVLTAVSGLKVIVMIDDADDLFDDRGECKDRELRELIITLGVQAPEHSITLLFSVQHQPAAFLGDLRRRAKTLSLERGLPRLWAKNLLRSLDHDQLGLGTASEAELDRLYDMTRGHPRSLELIVGLLRTTAWTVAVLANRIDGLPDAPEVLLQLMADELTRTELRVMQALAVYGRPVPPKAVDYLLHDIVQGADSRGPLHRLFGRNLVRRREDHYYIPRVPDAQFFLSTLLDGRVAASGLDRPTLWQQATSYLQAQRVHPVRTVDDLWPRLGEIELHLRIGEANGSIAALRAALELMDDIDDRYLARWGQSRIFTAWRRRLIGALGEPALEGRNLSYLVAAVQQQDGQPDDLDNLRKALRHAADARDSTAATFVKVQLGIALFEAGFVTEAAGNFREGITSFEKLRCGRREAGARLEYALCLAKGGKLEEAQHELARAWLLIKPLPLDDHREIRVRLLQNVGWVASQLGHDEEALARIDQALDLAGFADNASDGELHNAKAAVLLYSGKASGAIVEAEKAAAIGERRAHYAISREAAVNRALALLLRDNPGDEQHAMQAADSAAQFSSTVQALGALAVKGVVAFRLGDEDKARMAFFQAFAKSDERFSRDQHDYQMLNARGLALCGLALLRERQVQDAIDAYESARAITCAPGVIRRNHLHLDLFGPHADQAILAQVRAASGRASVDDWS
ncbi:glycosyltransferase [Micromonospora sp. NPDC048905]|uniref:glycosyltransferase n=1 Tax=Micromonospora sp. NPDC048905 TaxID=3155494 RepID=UPI0033D6ABF0